MKKSDMVKDDKSLELVKERPTRAAIADDLMYLVAHELKRQKELVASGAGREDSDIARFQKTTDAFLKLQKDIRAQEEADSLKAQTDEELLAELENLDEHVEGLKTRVFVGEEEPEEPSLPTQPISQQEPLDE